MQRSIRRTIRLGGALTVGLAFLLGGRAASGGDGSFSQAVPIEVPSYRGLEPRLALGYSSQGRGGFAGVGWGLSGFSVVERTSPGLGSPRFDASDVFVLDGRELIPCPAGTSPSCTTGGTHTTKAESYLRIKFDSTANTWTIASKDGTRTVLASVFSTPTGTLTWGQASVVDTHGNTAAYTWACSGGDCYPDSVAFGPYSVKLYRESRPDLMSAATGNATTLRWTAFRLRSILVTSQTSPTSSKSPVRAYRLSYAPSDLTTRSLLVAVQQYGKDVLIDGSGAISGGTSLPAYAFEYQADPGGKSFQLYAQ